MYYNLGLTKRKGLSNKNPSTAICKGGKSQLSDLFSQPMQSSVWHTVSRVP